MASNQTVKNIVSYVNFGHSWNILPFKQNRNSETRLEIEISLSWKYGITTCVAIGVAFTLVLVGLKELLLNWKSLENENIVFYFAVILMWLTAMGSQLWIDCHKDSILSLINTFLGFNQHLGRLF